MAPKRYFYQRTLGGFKNYGYCLVGGVRANYRIASSLFILYPSHQEPGTIIVGNAFGVRGRVHCER